MSVCNVKEFAQEEAPTLKDCLQGNVDNLLPILQVQELWIAKVEAFTRDIIEHTKNTWHIKAIRDVSLPDTKLKVESLKPFRFTVSKVNQETSSNNATGEVENGQHNITKNGEKKTAEVNTKTQLWFLADIKYLPTNDTLELNSLSLDRIRYITDKFVLDRHDRVQAGSVSTTFVENTVSIPMEENLVAFGNTVLQWISKPSESSDTTMF